MRPQYHQEGYLLDGDDTQRYKSDLREVKVGDVREHYECVIHGFVTNREVGLDVAQWRQ